MTKIRFTPGVIYVKRIEDSGDEGMKRKKKKKAEN